MINVYRFEVTPESMRSHGMAGTPATLRMSLELWMKGVEFAMLAMDSSFVFTHTVNKWGNIEFSTDNSCLAHEIIREWKKKGFEECYQIGGKLNGEVITESNPVKIE